MRKRYLLGALALIACLIVGGSVAYFSAQDNGDNAFAMGKVKIELTEPNWNAGEDHLIKPGGEIAKDPQVTNTGTVDCYVRINVVVSEYKALKASVLKDGAPDSDFEPNKLLNITDENWQLTGEPVIDTTENNKVTYKYVYAKELAPGETTPPLFDKVKFPETMDVSVIGDAADKFLVTVSADGIQSKTSRSATEAFDEFD